MTAITMAIPGVPGLHMETVTSQVPAQAFPLLAMESGAARFRFPLWTTYWMWTPRTLPPAAFLPDAVNARVVPTSMEAVGLGLNVTLDTPSLPRLEVLLPRQPVRATTNPIAKVRRKPGPQRCMNPPRARLRGASKIWMDGKLPV